MRGPLHPATVPLYRPCLPLSRARTREPLGTGLTLVNISKYCEEIKHAFNIMYYKHFGSVLFTEIIYFIYEVCHAIRKVLNKNLI